MTLNKAIFLIIEEFPIISKYDLYELIFFLSEKINNNLEIALMLTKEIDFNFNDLKNLVEKNVLEFKPISRITNTIYFGNVKIKINDLVFAPRIETEFWVNEYLNNHGGQIDNYIDLCCGSGAISILLANNLKIKKTQGIDINEAAIKLSKMNAKDNNLEINFEHLTIEKWLDNLQEKYDLVTCNPPYISYDDQNVDKSALLYDPENSLFCEDDGLYFYKLVINNLDNILNPNGKIIFEIGYNQKEKIQNFLEPFNKNYFFKKDNFNNWRTLIIIKE